METSRKPKQNDAMTILFVVIAALISAINLNTFVHAGGLFPGGFNGFTVLIQRIASTYFHIDLPFSLINYALNALPAYIGFKLIGKKFTIYSILMIILTGILVDFIPVHNITEDILLISIFGGIVNGIALSIALKGNASSGGTDFISMWISKYTGQSSWNYVLGINAVMLVIAGYLFGWDKALYSIIFQFCSTQVVNTLHTRYKRMTMLIVTSCPKEIIAIIQTWAHHGVTQLEGIGTYSGKPRTLLYTVVNTNDIKYISTHVRKVDPTAFVNVIKTEMIGGNFYLEPIK
ncbi:MAG: YitT family protein [Erysipelotrichaceae bacterium]|nr:YitT family protein [Erysipelotrichaceae bacterium]MCI9523463.1 YitT family protein [Erysipelotrichaceae bacterium]